MISLSIIIPVFNEVKFIEKVLYKIDQLIIDGSEKQIIIVDDGSNDGTIEVLQQIKLKNLCYQIIYNENNLGKAQAIKKGLQYANGECVALVDADEEVDVSVIVEWLSSIKPEVDAVIGVRKYENIDNKFYFLGRYLLSVLFRKLFHTEVQDPLVGLKLIRGPVIKSMELRSNGFEIDSEIIIRLINGGYKFEQKLIKYTPRNINEGKKLRFYHAIAILTFWFKEALK